MSERKLIGLWNVRAMLERGRQQGLTPDEVYEILRLEVVEAVRKAEKNRPVFKSG